MNFNLGNLNFNNEQVLNTVRQQIQEQVPNAVYNQATQMNLADMALNAIVKNAVGGFTNEVLNTQLGQEASPLLSQVPGLLGMAHQMGLDTMIQQVLSTSHLDETLRDAVIEGFSRYLRDNAGHMAQIALQALIENAGPKH